MTYQFTSADLSGCSSTVEWIDIF